MSERPYRSVYGQARVTPLGTFINFQVNIEPVHIQTGYWRFAKEDDGEDDLRAFQLGFQNPEQVLLAAVSDEGHHDNHCDGISLCWQPGDMDTFQVSRSGTARQHIQYITQERIQLGQSASFQGSVPVYPVDSERRLLRLRQRYMSGPALPRQDSSSSEISQRNKQPLGRYSSWPHAQISHQNHAHLATGSGGATTTSHWQNGSGSLLSSAFLANVNPQVESSRSASTGAKYADAPQTLPQSQSPVASSLGGHTPQPPEYARYRYASSAATIPFQAKFKGQSPTNGSPTQSQSHCVYPQGAAGPASNASFVAQNITAYNGYGQSSENTARRLPGSLHAPQETAPTGSYTSPYASPYASPHGSVSPYRSQDASDSAPRLSPYGALLYSGQGRSASPDASVISNPPQAVGARGYYNGSHQQHRNIVTNSPYTPKPSQHAAVCPDVASNSIRAQDSRPQGVIAGNTTESLSQAHIGFDRSARLPVSASFASKPKPEDVSSGVEAPAAHGNTRKPASLQSLRNKLFEPTTTKSQVTDPTSAKSLKTADAAKVINSSVQKRNLDDPTVDILQTSPSPHAHADESYVNNNAPAHCAPTRQSTFVAPKKSSTVVSRIRGGNSKTANKDAFSIPIEVPLHSARYHPDDPFITQLLPLSADVPCMDCGGSEHHAYDCHIANIRPLENPNPFQLRDIAEKAEEFDPEQWREHWNPLPAPPETETMQEKLPDFAKIVRNEESYKNDPDLQGLPDEALVLLWALKSSKNTSCRIIYPNGEFQTPPGFEHLWDSDDEDGPEGTRENTEGYRETGTEATTEESVEGSAKEGSQEGRDVLRLRRGF